MTPLDEDREFARLLAELRRSDEASAPDFRRVLARPRASQAAPRSSLWRLAAAAGLLVVIGAAFLLVRRPAPEIGLQAAARTLAEWKAPTDSLLHTPGAELLGSIPHLVTQVPDYSSLDAAGFGRKATPRLTR